MNVALCKRALHALVPVALAAVSVVGLPAQAHRAGSKRVRTVLTAELPPNMNGKDLRATLISVQYGPGDASPPHTHPCPVVVYVLKGAVRSRVTGQQEKIYHAGDSFYEAPGGEHLVSANASNGGATQFLAFFVCDHSAPLSANLPKPGSGARR